MSPRDDASALERVRDFLALMDTVDSFKTSLDKAKIKAVAVKINPEDPKRCTTVFEAVVGPSLVNGLESLHGGAVAAMFDICTSFNIIAVAREGLWDGGHVSRTLNCTYLRPAPLGTQLLIESETVHLGKNMCLIKGVIKRKSDGVICYTCEHNKVRIEAPKI